MATPLSGHQRHLASAIAQVQRGKTDAEIEAVLRKTYRYLNGSEVADYIRLARQAAVKSAMVDGAANDEAISKYAQSDNNSPNFVASVKAKWIDRQGREQIRTVRVQIPKNATKEQANQLIRDEIKLMHASKGMYKGGKKRGD